MVTKGGLAAAMNTTILGSGKDTVVLAHGYGGDQSVWDKVAPRLAERCRVVLFDWCFSGAAKEANLYDAERYSSYNGFAEDLISVLEEVKVESAVFVGHSMSGIIGCIASIKRPDLFRQLVLVGSSPRVVSMEDYESGFTMSDVEQLFSSIETNFDEWASTFAPVVVDSNDPQSAHKVANSIKSMKPEVALHLAKTVFLGDYRNILEKVVTTCHIIHTKGDVVVPDSVTKYMQSKINGKCKIEIMDTTGHFPQLTAHDQFIKAIDRILDG